jgi:hypothetical protein
MTRAARRDPTPIPLFKQDLAVLAMEEMSGVAEGLMVVPTSKPWPRPAAWMPLVVAVLVAASAMAAVVRWVMRYSRKEREQAQVLLNLDGPLSSLNPSILRKANKYRVCKPLVSAIARQNYKDIRNEEDALRAWLGG